MSPIREIAFTGIPVTDIARARAFYENVLGLKPTMESAGGMWIEYDIGAATLGIGSYGEMWQPSPQGTCVALEVDDVDGAMAHLQAHGVTKVMDPMDSPVCRFGMISDPDGNKIIIHKRHAH
ncbi:MAG: VOC family protein [Chthoniobacter sp.]|nr:VOC family protein [Chthoniobacter sp.]